MFGFIVSPHITVTGFRSPHSVIYYLANSTIKCSSSIRHTIPLFYKFSIKAILAYWLGCKMHFPGTSFVGRLPSERRKTVQDVFGWSNPFEIINTIIVLVSVNMINLFLVFWIWNKGLGYKPMNRSLNNSPVSLQIDLYISIALCNWLEISYGLIRKFRTYISAFIDFIISIKTFDFLPHGHHPPRTGIVYHEPCSNASVVRNILV